jgi:uncharacterized SAM-binding protein YcdF (DUF218 family)
VYSVFFVTSKIFWIFASPINLLLFGSLAGIVLCYSRHARFGRALAFVAVLTLAAATMSPLGLLLIGPLEDRFPQPPADLEPPYGIVVLGGAINDVTSTARGQTIFDEGAERVTEAVLLAKRYPRARVIYTGGTSSLTGGSSTEALRAKALMTQLGVAPDRITIEDKARNTEENVRFAAATVHPQPSQTWLVVTSAFHIPRSGRVRKGWISPGRLSGSFSYTSRERLSPLSL